MQTSSLQQPQEPTIALEPVQLNRLTRAIQGLSRDQVNWASGYLAGLSQGQQLPSQQQSSAVQATILYASHTGNGRGIAENLAQDAKARGLNSRVLSAADYKPRDLSKEQILFLVISTHGEGEVPESAAELERYLFSQRAPDLKQLGFSVFALGDSSYEYFCEAGKRFDARLQELGASRLLERVDADVTFEAAAKQWSEQSIETIRETLSGTSNNVVNLSGASGHSTRIDRSNPYRATLLDNRPITTDNAVATIHHIVLEIDPQVIHYQPGDALGVKSKNDLSLVSEIIETLQLDAESSVTLDGQSFSLAQALTEKLELTLLHPTVVANWAQLSASQALLSLIDDARKLRAYAHDRQLIDLILEYPVKIDAKSLVEVLQPLQPRLYSIASSQQVTEDEVHLTVSALSYHAHGRSHLGTASNHLVNRLQEADVLDVYVAENAQFRLPPKGDTPVIMIGAGTGIAPFRAFLQQRQAEGVSGKNWLVFGNRHFKRDFLYQQDWVNFRNTGLLQKATLAFSRDTTTRAYIQDRLREEGQVFYQWLQQGAYIYVCGGVEMEKGVREAIAEIINTYGDEADRETDVLIEDLRSQGRYLKDVY